MGSGANRLRVQDLGLSGRDALLLLDALGGEAAGLDVAAEEVTPGTLAATILYAVRTATGDLRPGIAGSLHEYEALAALVAGTWTPCDVFRIEGWVAGFRDAEDHRGASIVRHQRPGRSVPEPPYTNNSVGVIGSVASVRHQVIQPQRHLAEDCQGRSWSYLVSMRASGRSRGCDLVKLREHMPECISEYLGTDYLHTSVEKQLAHSGEEDRRIDTSGTAKLAKAVGQRVAHLVDGGTGFGIGGHASTLVGSICDRHAAPVSLEAAPIRNRWQCSGRVPS